AADGGFLATSPEYQMKRLLAGGVPRLFQIGHVFRKGEVGVRHNPEFTMLEWYRAFETVDAVMADTEVIVAAVLEDLAGAEGVRGPGGAPLAIDLPFERIPVAEAFERHAGVSADEALALSDRDEETFFRLLVDRVEPALARERSPVFLIDYPI